MTDQPISLKVTEPPVERLRRLSLTPDVPREDLWRAIAESLINVNERLAELEASAARRTRSEAAFDPRRRPTDARECTCDPTGSGPHLPSCQLTQTRRNP